MPRPQFSFKTLLWLMVVVAAFLGGMQLQKRLDAPEVVIYAGYLGDEIIKMRDGTHWQRLSGAEASEKNQGPLPTSQTPQ